MVSRELKETLTCLVLGIYTVFNLGKDDVGNVYKL